jgi:hypothetical protein
MEKSTGQHRGSMQESRRNSHGGLFYWYFGNILNANADFCLNFRFSGGFG